MMDSLTQMEWQLDGWLQSEWLGGALPILKVVFWVLVFLFVIKIFKRSSHGPKRKAIGKTYRTFFVVVALSFTAILLYQATWQLTGFMRPDFVEFMQRYNRRPDSPTSRIIRGRIVDARGHALAENSSYRPSARIYPGGAAFCHIIGYASTRYGMSGVEAAEDAVLNGIAVRDASDWETIGRNLFVREEVKGRDVALTLLAPLQFEAHRQMEGQRGAVVVTDPRDGSILVLYSSPGFDPENISEKVFSGSRRVAPMLNRAIQGRYPAGSTMKLLVAAEALQQGIHPEFDCPAEGYTAGSGNRPIRDHEYYAYKREGKIWRGHGRLTMREALKKSSNTYFAQLGVQLGGEALQAAAVRCGLTRAWTIMDGSSGEITSMTGSFPPLRDTDVANTAQIAIGQGDMLVTPLHMALLAGAIGRGGALWSPRLSLSDPPRPVDVIFSSEAANQTAAMMRDAVRSGTGRRAEIRGLNVAGKTGTAQNPHGDDHGWFIGFAPADDPVIAFSVLVENGGYGSQSALPVATAILKKADEIGLFSIGEDGRQP